MRLRRYGVVCKRVLPRETKLAVVARAAPRLPAPRGARGDPRRAVRGGDVGGSSSLPEAVGQLRTVRRSEAKGELIGISAADPLNLTGIVTPGERIPALARSRVVYRDGIPVAALERGAVRWLVEATGRRGIGDRAGSCAEARKSGAACVSRTSRLITFRDDKPRAP